MLLNCRSLYALKFALVTKLEAMHHLALENMKNLKVTLFSLGPVNCFIYSVYIFGIRDLKIPRYRCTGTGSVPVHVKCSCA